MNIKAIINEELNKLNELKISKDFNDVNKIDGLFIIVYRGAIFFINYESDNFIEQTQKLYNILNNDNVLERKYVIDSFDSAIYFIEDSTTKSPNIIAGEFLINRSQNNEITLSFFNSEYYELKLSDELMKLIKMFPNIKWFRIDNELYSKGNLLNDLNGKVNTRTRIPKILYHGTSLIFCNDIMKQGLRPNSSNSVFNIKHEQYIFLTTSKNTANNYATASASRDLNFKNRKVIFEIDGLRLDPNKIEYDYDFYTKFVGVGNSDYDMKNNESYQLSNQSGKNKGGLYRKFGYNGVVLPQLFTNVNVEIHFNEWKTFTPIEFKKYLDVESK